MKRLLIALLVSLIAIGMFVPVSTTNAAQMSAIGLTEEQAAQLQLQAAQMKMKKNPVENITPAQVEKYASIGAAIGQSLVSTAKAVGQEVNDFVKTPVGMMAAALIAWSIVGHELASLAVGIAFFLLVFPMWIWSYRKFLAPQLDTVYEDKDKESGKVTCIRRVYHEINEDYRVGKTCLMFFFFAVIVGITNIIMFSGW